MLHIRDGYNLIYVTVLLGRKCSSNQWNLAGCVLPTAVHSSVTTKQNRPLGHLFRAKKFWAVVGAATEK